VFENDPAAITKHLRVLDAPHRAQRARRPRKPVRFDPQPMNELQEYLRRVSAQWIGAVEAEDPGRKLTLGPHLKAAVNARIGVNPSAEWPPTRRDL